MCVYERDGGGMEDWKYFPAALTSAGCSRASVWDYHRLSVCKHHFGVNGRYMDLFGVVQRWLDIGVGVDVDSCVRIHSIYSWKQDALEQSI